MTEAQLAAAQHKRAADQYSASPSFVVRVVEYTPDDPGAPAEYTHQFKNPFLPLAVLEYNVADSPFAGVMGLDIDVVHEMTEGNYAEIMGFNMVTLLQDYPTRIMLYSILKEDPSDLEYIYQLAERFPEEIWLQPQTVTVGEPGDVADIFANSHRLLILEKR